MRYWTEHEAWGYLAWLWRAADSGFRDGARSAVTRLMALGRPSCRPWGGICAEINELAGSFPFRPRHISGKTAGAMRRRLPRRRQDGLFCWPLTTVGDRSRLAFCRRMVRKTLRK